MSRIAVTGSSGFLGKHIVPRLRAMEHEVAEVPHEEFDLLDRNHAIRAFQRVDGVIHAAAVVGGIVYNDRMPGRIWLENTMMGVNVLDAVFSKQVNQFVIVGTACSYPDECPETGFTEGHMFRGRPTEENAGYGIAKAGVIEGARSLAKQESLRNWGAIILANLYGPGDRFGSRAHVVPDLISKFWIAVKRGVRTVRLFGSGEEMREFLYVDDAAAAVIRFYELLAQEQEGYRIVNFGSGTVLRINEIAARIAAMVGYTGKIEWSGRLRGQAAKRLNLAKARIMGLGIAQTAFEPGLRETVKWAVAHLEKRGLPKSDGPKGEGYGG